MRQRKPREHQGKHLDFIRSMPCVVCLDNTSTEACHVRMGDMRAAKESTGMGQKPDDRWTVPLCGDCHRKQHEWGEENWWHEMMMSPTFIALALHSVSGDHDAGETIIRAYHS